MLNAEDVRKIFISSVKHVNAIVNDIVKHGYSSEIDEYAQKYAHIEEERNEFVRVNWGGAYAYIDLNKEGKPTGEIWWNNEDIGCGGLGYEETLDKLSNMSEDELLDTDEVSYYDDTDVVENYIPNEYVEFRAEG